MNVRKKLVLIGLILILGACKQDPPENILSEAQMTAILMDVYLTESNIAHLRFERDSSIKVFKVYEEMMYEKYQIDSSTYHASLTYYYDNLDKLDKIYETIIDSLTLMESKLKAKEKAAKDSTKASINKN